MAITLEHTTSETLLVTISTSGDPTGALPEFSLTAVGATDPGTWVPGTWETAWDATSGSVVASTPLVGETGGLALTDGASYQLWSRWTISGETPVRKAATIVST